MEYIMVRKDFHLNMLCYFFFKASEHAAGKWTKWPAGTYQLLLGQLNVPKGLLKVLTVVGGSKSEGLQSNKVSTRVFRTGL